ncbi:MAG: S-adenosylmethionine:tRNA ribosyltransferase-isomerase [Bacteroidales bacterium]|jgi:S-adenosylmethionine:tRNA ribosyltransferase-isomerase|nr:S-adenosylmethionine:tRNA ribosyltransferase-isomerase [Bacteroidales bacterium]
MVNNLHYSNIEKLNINDFNYTLPDDKIAYFPIKERNQSKLLVYKNGKITDAVFQDFYRFLEVDHLIIFNDSKVIHARLLLHNQNGTKIEIFCLEPLFPTTELTKAFEQKGLVKWKCMVGNAKRWKEPLYINLVSEGKEICIKATKGVAAEGVFEVTFEWEADITFAEWIEIYGKMPLPPYIKREAAQGDDERYQTVYAHHQGSVAAPTAGLHFSEADFHKLTELHIPYDFITLHVGAGTFKPVSADFISDHYMHYEQIVMTRKLLEFLLQNINKKIIAVGTTVTRSLESLFLMGEKLVLHYENPFQIRQWDYLLHPELNTIKPEAALHALIQYCNDQQEDTLFGSTQLMIIPGYQHHLVKGLFTNFHQPKSTLLLLIASFLGEQWKTIYQHALEHEYRFLSYGDANLYLV